MSAWKRPAFSPIGSCSSSSTRTGAFIGPEAYPPLALATIGSHDLATLHGWWEERDIDLKARHGLYPSEDEERHQREQRAKERVALLDALAAAGLRRPEGLDATGPFCPELADAVHAFLARTRSGLAMVQLDDLTDETDQVNLPATTDEHPNWRRKQSLRLEELAADRRVRALADILNKARPPACEPEGRPMSADTGTPVPRATYRLQFSKDFGFEDAARLAPYLAALGVSHLYASPYLKARPGSTHGYDIVDHNALNPELGTEDDFRAMVEALKANGLGQILDFVPNHMGVGGADNAWWLDVLEWGPDSACAGYFDIDWEPDARYLQGKLLVPFLGEQYGVVLEAGGLELRFDETAGTFAVWAYETHKLPICPLRLQSDPRSGASRA